MFLDGFAEPNGFGVTSAAFEHWASSPLVLSDYDAWCRGGTGTARSVPLPSTLVPAASEAAALRFTLEWSDANVPWQLPMGATRQKNIQSFAVVVR